MIHVSNLEMNQGFPVSKRKGLPEQFFTIAVPKLLVLGISLKSINLKDITFPGELKKIFSEVIKAQKEGLAALERARGESAALRHLANAAKLIEGNPALMQLRILQTVGAGSGNTIVLGSQAADQVLPLKSCAGRPSTPEVVTDKE